MRLDNVRAIIERTLQTLDNNPQIVTQLLSTVDNTVNTVGGVANNTVGTVGGMTAGPAAQRRSARPRAQRPDRGVSRRSTPRARPCAACAASDGAVYEVVTDTANRILRSTPRRLLG